MRSFNRIRECIFELIYPQYRALLLGVLFHSLYFMGVGSEAASPELIDLIKQQNTLQACKVLNVFDGDTLACDLNHNGRLEKPREYIRLLGIDAPETSHSKKYRAHPRWAGRNEAGAVEAAQFLKKASPVGSWLFIETDTRVTDPYGRTLAFVYKRSTAQPKACSLNEEMVALGLVKLLFIAPNFKHLKTLQQAEFLARQKGLGLWQH